MEAGSIPYRQEQPGEESRKALWPGAPQGPAWFQEEGGRTGGKCWQEDPLGGKVFQGGYQSPVEERRVGREVSWGNSTVRVGQPYSGEKMEEAEEGAASTTESLGRRRKWKEISGETDNFFFFTKEKKKQLFQAQS